jgi:peroxiredoxin
MQGALVPPSGGAANKHCWFPLNTPTSLEQAFEAVCMTGMPLRERMAAFTAVLRRAAPEFAGSYDELVSRLEAAHAGASAPGVGQQMPPFVLPSGTGRILTLQDLTAQGPLVISLNRGHWCAFCRMELRDLAAHAEQMARLGAQVVSIVPDRQGFLHRLRVETDGRITLLSDIDNSYALSLGLMVWLGSDLEALLREFGVDLAVIQGNAGALVPIPATFVVGRDGRIAARFVDPDFRNRMEITEIVAALERLAGR